MLAPAAAPRLPRRRQRAVPGCTPNDDPDVVSFAAPHTKQLVRIPHTGPKENLIMPVRSGPRFLPFSLGLVCLLAAGCSDSPVEANPDHGARFHENGEDPGGSHFRYAALSWKPGSNAGEIEFQLKAAFRRSAYAGTRCIGTCADGYPGVGDQIVEDQGPTTLTFGDGTVSPTLRFRVTSVDLGDPASPFATGWVLGEMIDPTTGRTGVSHTYPGSGPYSPVLGFTSTLTACCRVGANLLNNRASGRYPIQTVIGDARGSNSAPVSGLLPIASVTQGSPATFVVPARDPDGDRVRFRLATDEEAGGPSHPPGLAIDPSTGVVSWSNAGLDMTKYWTTQVMVEDLDGLGNVKTKAPVDFLLKIVAGTPPSATATTPASGTVFGGSVGSTITFNVGFTAGSAATTTASIAPANSQPLAAGAAAGNGPSFSIAAVGADPSQVLTLNNTGLPPGASFPAAAPGATVQSTFTWTPTAQQQGTYVVTFFATDGRGVSSPPVSVVLDVRTAVPVRVHPPLDLNPTAERLIPVAILSTSSFDARDVRVATVTLGDEDGNDTPAAVRRNGTTMTSLEDVDGDGRADLKLFFAQASLLARRDLTAATTELVLLGQLNNRYRIRGVDAVTVRR